MHSYDWAVFQRSFNGWAFTHQTDTVSHEVRYHWERAVRELYRSSQIDAQCVFHLYGVIWFYPGSYGCVLGMPRERFDVASAY